MKINSIIISCFTVIFFGVLFSTHSVLAYTAAQLQAAQNYINNHPAAQVYVSTHPEVSAAVNSAPTQNTGGGGGGGGGVVVTTASCPSPKCSYKGTCYAEGRTFSGYTCSSGEIEKITASPTDPASCVSPKCFYNNGCYGDGTSLSVNGKSYQCSGGNISQISAGGSCSAPNCKYANGICASNGGNTIYGGICYKCSNTAINAVSMSNCTGGGDESGASVTTPGGTGSDPGHGVTPPFSCTYPYRVASWSSCVNGLSHANGFDFRASTNPAVCNQIPQTTRTCSGPTPGPGPGPGGGGGVGGGVTPPAGPTTGVCGLASSPSASFASRGELMAANLCYLTGSTPVSPPAPLTGFGPWYWTCSGLSGGAPSGICTANQGSIPSGDFDCTSLTTNPSSPVNINTNTTLTAHASSTGSVLWTIVDANGTFSTTTSGMSIDKIFNTIGQKNITAQVSSSTYFLGAPCNISTTVVQQGGNSREI
jgi:hypothetical protein